MADTKNLSPNGNAEHLLVVNHLLHNYIVDDEDVQKKLDLPVLGFIPEV